MEELGYYFLGQQLQINDNCCNSPPSKQYLELSLYLFSAKFLEYGILTTPNRSCELSWVRWIRISSLCSAIFITIQPSNIVEWNMHLRTTIFLFEFFEFFEFVEFFEFDCTLSVRPLANIHHKFASLAYFKCMP